MNPLTLLQNMTSADVQRYVRIGLQWLASYLVTHGMIKADASWIEPVSGFLVGLASLVWTIYGNRLTAKIAEMAAIAKKPNTPVQGVIMADTPEGKEIAVRTPGPVVTAGTSAATEIAKS